MGTRYKRCNRKDYERIGKYLGQVQNRGNSRAITGTRGDGRVGILVQEMTQLGSA